MPNNKNLNNYYVVKVTSKPKSKLSGKKVFSKTDVYVIKAHLESRYLLQREYILTENDLKDFDYKVIENTGISVKLKKSKKYTIQKFTKESFLKAFSNYLQNPIYTFFALLLYSNDKEQFKNAIIAEKLGIDYNKFLKDMEDLLGIKSDNIEYKKYYDDIRTWAKEEVKKIIDMNHRLAESIFMGKYWFDDPYYASFIFVHGDLIENKVFDYIITTGSGRSKGKYSIEIKPK